MKTVKNMLKNKQRMLIPQPDLAYKQVGFEKAAAAKDKRFSAQERKEKLDEFRKLQKLHWEGTSQPGISKSELAKQTINQHSDGFSIVNLQWASFASRATIIISVATVGLLVTFCCYYRERNNRKHRESHHLLL